MFVEDELGPGGAPHHYEIRWPSNWRPLSERGVTFRGTFQTALEGEAIVNIDFQKGGVVEAGGINGVTHEALLAIVIDRLQYFQRGPFASEDNRRALDALTEALVFLQHRTRRRIERGVEGLSVS